MHFDLDLESGCPLLVFCFMRRGMTWCTFICICFRFGWSNWTSACVSTVTFLDPVNRFPTGFFSIIQISSRDLVAFLFDFFVMKMLKE